MAKKRDLNGAPGSLELDVDISNFGPISKGKFKIKPLTILIGPNNSGKTYASMLIHAMFSSHAQTATYWLVPEFIDRQVLRTEFRDLALQMSKFLRAIPPNGGHITIPSSYVNAVKEMLFRQTIEEHLPQNLTENFGLPLHDMIRINTNLAKFKISSHDKVTVNITKKIKAKYDFPDYDHTLTQNAEKALSIWPAYLMKKQYDNMRNNLDKTIHKYITQLVSRMPTELEHGTIALLSLILRITFMPDNHLPGRSFYLPAARSGIMHAYKPILSNAIRSYVHKKDVSHAPATTGVVSDLLRSLINAVDDTGTPVSEIGKNLETDLFSGKILLHETLFGAPEIYYKFMEKDLPIHASSSSIAENAPLTIFLRHKVHPEDLLIIEEPEAHLHPANQLILARHLVHLVRSGVRVFVTTHSVFFLEKLSMFVKMGSLKEKQRRDKNYGKHDYLLDSEVAPYVFQKNSTGDYTIKEIDHSPTRGISQEEFVNVSLNMYNEDTLLNDTIGNNGDD